MSDLDVKALLEAIEENELGLQLTDLWPQAIRALVMTVPELPRHPHAKGLGCYEGCEAGAGGGGGGFATPCSPSRSACWSHRARRNRDER